MSIIIFLLFRNFIRQLLYGSQKNRKLNLFSISFVSQKVDNRTFSEVLQCRYTTVAVPACFNV